MTQALLLLVALFSWYSIQVVGMLFPAEIVLCVLLIVSNGKKRLMSEKLPRQIILLGLLWLLSQFVTDIIRQSPIDNLLKGAAEIIFFLTDFSALYLLLTASDKRIIRFTWAYALGLILQFIVAPTAYAQFEPWKWALGPAVTLMFFLLLGSLKSGSRALIACLLLAIFDLFMNFRSMAGFTLLSGVLLYLAWNPLLISKLTSLRGRVVLPVITILFGVGILMAYQWAAESRLLPEDVTAKYEMNKSSKLGIAGLILGGRTEWVSSVPAVIDSPIIGHGSWAEDRKYAQMQLLVNSELGLDIDEAQIEAGANQSDLIPAHSHLMQAWVWAGILGAWFWIRILGRVLKLLKEILFTHSRLQPVAIYSGISFVWAIFFSPFGSAVRIQEALTLVVLVMASKSSSGHRSYVKT